uniref:Ig-like domain-containing protein n=1 Tax=Esox lucius TaxID=8010 RepID=A0A3P9AKZ9_ESOLU
GSQNAIEEVGHGKIETNSERADRLKVGSHCSLHISDVRAEDAGKYTCQQYLSNGSQHGSDAPVHLSVLNSVSGDTHSLFTRVGDNVSLSCTNVVYPNCSSTTWNHHIKRLETTIEEVGHGKIKTNSERADRLKVGSDCSLHVRDVRAEDAGIYNCKQILSNGSQHGGDAPVHLSVLTNSLSTPVTDTKPDRPVTLRCFLYTYDGPGNCSRGVTEHVSLLWLDETGNKLKKDSRHQVTQTSDCDITLTLQKEDNNRKWICQ